MIKSKGVIKETWIVTKDIRQTKLPQGGKKAFLVSMSFIYFYLKVLIYNINILRIYLLLMEWFLWCSLEGQTLYNEGVEENVKQLMSSFICQTWCGKEKKYSYLFGKWPKTKQTNTHTHKTTPPLPKTKPLLPQKKKTQPIPKLIWNFILKLNLQQTYCFTRGRGGSHPSSKYFQPEKNY